MEIVDNSCRCWYKQLTAALDIQQKKRRHGNGPLAEIDYWRERNASLSALYEQLVYLMVTQRPLSTVSLFNGHSAPSINS